MIDAEGEQVGVVSRLEALRLASEAGLDLVEIVPTAEPPVCRIMDYGKHKFELNKRAQQAKKRQRQIHIKEVKLRPGTEEADYQVKLRNVFRFLEVGDKVKVTLRFRGRELRHQEFGMRILERIEEDVKDSAVIEQRPRLEGRFMVMMLSPKKK